MTKKLKSVEEEAADCRAAFAGIGVNAPIWCCHHDALSEFLRETPENRINYILEFKPKSEQARRLREFRPVKGSLPAPVLATWNEFDSGMAAWENYATALCTYRKEIDALHKQECPDSTWDGYSIFGM